MFESFEDRTMRRILGIIEKARIRNNKLQSSNVLEREMRQKQKGRLGDLSANYVFRQNRMMKMMVQHAPS